MGCAQRRFGPYSVVQPPYSLIDPAGENDLLPYCQSENIGVMVYSPMHKGLLTGKYTGAETFSDFRSKHPLEMEEAECMEEPGLGFECGLSVDCASQSRLTRTGEDYDDQ